MKVFIKIFTTILFIFSTYLLNAQGCSDAGFCTINSFKPKSSGNDSLQKNQLKMGVSLGSANYSISIFGTYLEYNRQLNDRLGFDAKFTTLSQVGNGISAFGLSDIYFDANYKLIENLKLTVGAKIPFTSGDTKQNNLALPMDYQSSLGTLDIILGLGYQIGNWQLVAALQQPLTQNKNEFFAESYPANSALSTFQSTNNFKRSSDILFRASYKIKLSDKFKITPSILPIYHLGTDKFTDVLNVEKSIAGSDGLTLNGNAYFDYDINNKNALQFNIGVPFVVRNTRPDGLTRSFVVNLEYRFKF